MEKGKLIALQTAVLVAVVVVLAFVSYAPVIRNQANWIEVPGLAADFAAFYNAGYSLVFHPSNVYSISQYPVPDAPRLVYPPWFLLFSLPFNAFAFPEAEMLFSAAQLLLLPVLAFLIYKLFKPSGQLEYFATALVIEVALLEPFDSRYVGVDILPQVVAYLPLLVSLALLPFMIGSVLTRKSPIAKALLTLASVALGLEAFGVGLPALFPVHSGEMTVTGAYWSQWVLGQSKVLELTLIVLALVLATRMPVLSFPVLLLSAFDPRFTLLALPLYVYLIARGRSVRAVGLGALLSLALVVLPFALYYGVFGEYVSMVARNFLFAPGGGQAFVFWDYEWMIFYATLVLEGAYFGVEAARRRESGLLERRKGGPGGI